MEEMNEGSVESRNRVKILMLQRDISQVQIVNKYKFDKGDVSKVVHGKRKTKAIQEAIARELEMSVEDVFGGAI
jgi:hypothetical protein